MSKSISDRFSKGASALPPDDPPFPPGGGGEAELPEKLPESSIPTPGTPEPLKPRKRPFYGEWVNTGNGECDTETEIHPVPKPESGVYDGPGSRPTSLSFNRFDRGSNMGAPSIDGPDRTNGCQMRNERGFE